MMRKWLTGLLMTVVLAFGVATPSYAAIVTPTVDAQAAAVVDVQTGQVLADKNGDKRIPIASISKLLTAYLVERSIEAGKLTMDTPISVPASIVAISTEPGLANVPLSTERTYTVRELMEMALIKSANAAALALGYAVSGTPTGINQEIQDLLTDWGITDTTIVSGAGLTNGDMGSLKNKNLGDDVENELSARELAIVGRHLVEDYPSITEITSMTSAVVPSGVAGTETIKNSNALLTDGHGYEFKGLKTGYALSVHSTFIGLTKLDNREVITVVLGSDHTFTQTAAMLDQVKAATQVVTLKKGTQMQRVPVEEAKDGHRRYPLVTNKTVSLFAPKSWDDAKVNMTIRSNHDMIAPISKGHIVDHNENLFVDGGSKTEVRAANDFVDGFPQVNLIMNEDVAQASQLVQWYRDAKRVIANLFD